VRMGAGASMDPMTAVAPYPTVEAALADGKSQAEIDAFLAVATKAAAATAGAEKAFIASATFDGAKDGYDFKAGANGTGYYLRKDGTSPAVVPTASSTSSSAKSNPFGDAKPVSVKSNKPSPFGDAIPVSVKPTKPNPFGDAKPRSVKPNPFGDAKPVSVKSNPFGDAKPVDTKPKATKPAASEEKSTDASGEDLTAMYGKKKKKKKKKKEYVA
jgi:hypothetical protein